MFQDGLIRGISSKSLQQVTANPAHTGLGPLPLVEGSLTCERHHAHPASEERRMTARQHCLPSVPFQQFQVLFNSLFKVLCIFPSRYLFAIGLPPVFSFRWNLPPASGCTPKQPDSTRAHRTVPLRRLTGFSPSPIPRSKGFWRRGGPMAPLQTTIQEAAVTGLRISGVSSARFIRHY